MKEGKGSKDRNGPEESHNHCLFKFQYNTSLFWILFSFIFLKGDLSIKVSFFVVYSANGGESSYSSHLIFKYCLKIVVQWDVCISGKYKVCEKMHVVLGWLILNYYLFGDYSFAFGDYIVNPWWNMTYFVWNFLCIIVVKLNKILLHNNDIFNRWVH